jgi:hypothetical protein
MITRPNRIEPPPARPIDYLPGYLVEQSHRNFAANRLWQYMASRIGSAAAQFIFDMYQVGTSRYWPGATAYWQLDTKGRPRQCKVMLYDPDTGRRVKAAEQTYIAYLGKRLAGKPDPNLMQCLFGTHLLAHRPGCPVAIVESEKTALFCAWYFPQYVWLATGGKAGCRWNERAVFEPLKGRTIVLFPDVDATADWKKRATQLAAMVPCRINVSEYLENRATPEQLAAGLDLWDFIQEEERPEPISNTAGPDGYPAWWDWQGPPANVREAERIYQSKAET